MNCLDFDLVMGYCLEKVCEFWFGIEQEYYVINDEGILCSYDFEKFNYDILGNFL